MCFSIVSTVSVWCHLDVRVGSPDGRESVMDHSEKGKHEADPWSQQNRSLPVCTQTWVCFVCSLERCFQFASVVVGAWLSPWGPWSGCTHIPASPEPALRSEGAGLQIPASSSCRALGRQWFTSRNKCFARVGLRRDYRLKHGVVIFVVISSLLL